MVKSPLESILNPTVLLKTCPRKPAGLQLEALHTVVTRLSVVTFLPAQDGVVGAVPEDIKTLRIWASFPTTKDELRKTLIISCLLQRRDRLRTLPPVQPAARRSTFLDLAGFLPE